MKQDYLELKRCSESKQGFRSGKEYIILEKDKTYSYDNGTKPCYKAVNDSGCITIINLTHMFSNGNRVIQPLKHVVYLGLSNKETLEADEVYSVFEVTEQNGESYYLIFDNINQLKLYPTSLFISESEYNKISDKELLDLKKSKEKATLDADKLRRERDEQSLKEKLELKKIEDINNLELTKARELSNIEFENINKFIKALRPNIKENTNIDTNTISEFFNKGKKISTKTTNIFITTTTVLLFNIAIIGSVSNTLISGVFLLIASIMYLITDIKRFKDKPEIIEINTSEKNNPDKDYISLMLSFSDDILLKLKKIELSLVILENGATITNETISLIKESVSFCLESYKTKDANLLRDIDIFLDKTLEYIDSLIDGNNSEELYIEKQVYENISSVINRNTGIFEAMISDNKKIKEILNRDGNYPTPPPPSKLFSQK